MAETENIVNGMQINGISPDGLRQLIRAAVRAELDDFVKAVQSKPDPLIKRVDAAKMLGVSLPTLDKYAKYGILHPRHCGGRVCYALSELEKQMFYKK